MPPLNNPEPSRARRAAHSAFLLAVLAAGVAASLAIAGNWAAPSAGAVASLSLTATDRNACAPTSLTAGAGTVTLSYTNATSEWQSFGIVGIGGGSPDRVRDGGTSTLTAALSPGTYTVWCGDDPSKAAHVTLSVTAAGSTPGTTTTGGTTTTTPPAPATANVTIGDDFFSPTAFTVGAGQVTVTVTNTGRNDHTWSVVGGLANVIVPAGQTKTATFTATPGTYTFFCAYHSVMRGTMTVTGPAGSPPPTTTGTTTTTTTPPPPSSGPSNLTVSDFSFSPSSLSVNAGDVTVIVHNAGQVPHTFTIDGVVNAPLQPGETKTLTFQLAAGTYRFYCAVSGHASLGMVGTITAGAGGGGPAPPPTMTGMTMPATTTAAAPGSATHAGAAGGTFVRCRTKSAFRASGTLMAIARTSLTMHVTRTTPAGTRYRGKHLALPVRAGATFTSKWGSSQASLKPGQRVRVDVGRCATTPRRLVATRIVELTAPAGKSTGAAGAGTLAVTTREFKFDPPKLTAKPGTITLKVTNAGKLPHTYTIDGLVNVKVEPGHSRTVTFKAAAGTYAVYCAELGHKSAGMTATLVVG